MHQTDLNFSINNIELSKIEGHAKLDIEVKEGKVKDVKLKIIENKRFFEDAIKGKNFVEVPQTVSRICGTCSAAHLMASILSIEDALSVEVDEETKKMRKILLNGAHIRDHAMHLYLFVLPDYLGEESIISISEKNPKLVKKAFEIKKAGNLLTTLIGGSAVHCPLPQIGGFARNPEKEKIKETIKKLKEIREDVVEMAELFAEHPINLESPSHFISLNSDEFNHYEGIICWEKKCVPKYAFSEYLEKKVIPYSQARGFTYKGERYMVGALARINQGKEKIHKKTKKEMGKYLKRLPSNNIMDNNLAQAVEMVHEIDHSIELLEGLEVEKARKATERKREGIGVGVVEAPRGLLYYKIKIKEKRVEDAKIVLPTEQNQVKMEYDVGLVAEKLLEKGEEWVRRGAEMVIRAYDPCMSCATNFLKLRIRK